MNSPSVAEWKRAGPIQVRGSKPRSAEIGAMIFIFLIVCLFAIKDVRAPQKNRKILIRFLEFPSVKFLKIWQRSYSLLAFLAFNLSEKFVRQGFCLSKKHQKC